MFSNYFFLKRLVSSLEPKLSGLSLIECYSQNKDELIIGFAAETNEFWIRASLDPNISIISFPKSISRARKNSVDLFPSIKGLKVTGAEIFNFECSFRISFEKNFFLIF